MREYALIMLNILEHSCLYLNKQSSEYARTLRMPDAVYSIRLLYKLLSSYRDRGVCIQNTVKHLRSGILQKE